MSHFALPLSRIKLDFEVSVEINGVKGEKIWFSVPFFKHAEWWAQGRVRGRTESPVRGSDSHPLPLHKCRETCHKSSSETCSLVSGLARVSASVLLLSTLGLLTIPSMPISGISGPTWSQMKKFGSLKQISWLKASWHFLYKSASIPFRIKFRIQNPASQPQSGQRGLRWVFVWITCLVFEPIGGSSLALSLGSCWLHVTNDPPAWICHYCASPNCSHWPPFQYTHRCPQYLTSTSVPGHQTPAWCLLDWNGSLFPQLGLCPQDPG